jgi:hypothetical protein
MSDVKDIHSLFGYCEKDAVDVFPFTVEELPDFCFKKIVFKGKGTTERHLL